MPIQIQTDWMRLEASADSLLNSAGGWEDKFISAQALIRKLKEKSPEETSAWFRVKKQITLQKSNHTSERAQQCCNKALWEAQSW